MGQAFYSRFYERLLSRAGSGVSAKWLEQKRRIAEWLEREYLAPWTRGANGQRALSIGAGLGAIEASLLEKGYRVDVQECQETSLLQFKRQFPHAYVIVSDGRAIPVVGGTYDLVYMVGVDCCFGRADYVTLLHELKRVMRPGGRLVVVCLSNLSLQGIARHFGSRLLSRGARGVPWGYMRTIAEHVQAGQSISLSPGCIFFFDLEFTLKKKRRAMISGPAAIWPTLRDYHVAIDFDAA